MLPGSLTGITYYLQPELYRLLDTQVTNRVLRWKTNMLRRARVVVFFSRVFFAGLGGRGRSDILFSRCRFRGSLVVRVVQ